MFVQRRTDRARVRLSAVMAMAAVMALGLVAAPVAQAQMAVIDVAAIKQLVAQGWCDALRHLHPGQRIYTFWDYFRNAYGRDAGLRIDHLLLSPALAACLKDAGVDREVRGRDKPSDHAPTWIELDLDGIRASN